MSLQFAIISSFINITYKPEIRTMNPLVYNGVGEGEKINPDKNNWAMQFDYTVVIL